MSKIFWTYAFDQIFWSLRGFPKYGYQTQIRGVFCPYGFPSIMTPVPSSNLRQAYLAHLITIGLRLEPASSEPQNENGWIYSKDL